MLAQDPNFNLMERGVRRVARALLRDFGELQIMDPASRGREQFVRKALARAEEALHSELAETRPDYGFLGALGPVHNGRDPTRRWIFAPVDGVVNFTRGLPSWVITLALEHKGRISVALIYHPIENQLFAATKGGGAWMNKYRLRVSSPVHARDMVVALARDGGLAASDRDLSKCVHGIRVSGAPGLEFAHVAAGWMDALIIDGMGEFDRAGEMIVEEAGGISRTGCFGGTVALDVICDLAPHAAAKPSARSKA